MQGRFLAPRRTACRPRPGVRPVQQLPPVPWVRQPDDSRGYRAPSKTRSRSASRDWPCSLPPSLPRVAAALLPRRGLSEDSQHATWIGRSHRLFYRGLLSVRTSCGIAPSLRSQHWIGQTVNRQPISFPPMAISVEANRQPLYVLSPLWDSRRSTLWSCSGMVRGARRVRHLNGASPLSERNPPKVGSLAEKLGYEWSHIQAVNSAVPI